MSAAGVSHLRYVHLEPILLSQLYRTKNLKMESGTFLGIIAAVAAVVALPITFVIGRRARQRPDLRYVTDFDVLLRPSDRLFDKDLYMTLGDRKIDCISRTRIAFWNQRGDTVRGADTLEADPVRLEFADDDQPLQARIISTSREQIALTGSIDSKFDSCVIIGFDFLDAGDGGVIEVIHQGVKKPTVLGTIRGATTNSRGSTSLGPDALAQIGERSLFRRILNNAKYHKSASISWIFIAVTAFIVLGITTWPFWHNPGPLVNAHSYNLASRQGQIAFVNRVNNTDYYNRAVGPVVILITAASFLAFLAAISTSLFRKRKSRVPASIVANIYTEDGSADLPSASSEAAAEKG